MDCHLAELSTFEILLKLSFLIKQNILHLQRACPQIIESKYITHPK